MPAASCHLAKAHPLPRVTLDCHGYDIAEHELLQRGTLSPKWKIYVKKRGTNLGGSCSV
jgi:hypothetical protein